VTARWWAAMPVLLAGCSLAPPLPDPGIAAPTAYKESPAALAGDWKVATPADGAERGKWWEVFRDPVLNDLLETATANNQSIKVALARLEQSRARTRLADAARWPRIEAGAGGARVRPSTVPFSLEQYSRLSAGLQASWEVDLFGRVRDALQAARAEAAAEHALLANLMLSVQADAADNYFKLRALDDESIVVQRTIETREEAIKLIQHRVAAGDLSAFELEQQQAELESNRAELQALARVRAAYEHALAVLSGRLPNEFALAAHFSARGLPEVPAGIPSSVLERRPDIAAAQRRMVAANARIGVAKAAFYPVLNLTANFGLEANSFSDLFKWGSRTWALGPVAGTLLSLPVFDGGRNKANLAVAEAELDAEIANYRQTVLNAFGEVEDGLSGLRTLAAQTESLGAAIAAADRVFNIAESRYRAGQTGYLEVLDARRALIALRRQETQVHGSRATTTVALVRALGGGW